MSERSVKEIFSEALDRAPEERGELLAAACAGDEALRSQVEALLAFHQGAGYFLAAPTQGAGGRETCGAPASPEATASPLAERPGMMVGRYRLMEVIGEGGFGVVFLAEQLEPVVRSVALKVIKLGMDTRQVIARFEAERQALAMMDHPSIARVLDAGATETGRPYFVMELVNGNPITAYCDWANLDTAKRLDLFMQVCMAVQHAHSKGIIHRDLKPSNVLVTEIDGRPVPKIIDFGIAKATAARSAERPSFTDLQQFIGTPEYMSPEAAQSGADFDTRTDVYSLGVLLYELLTSTTPLDTRVLAGLDLGEAQRMIREEETPNPSARLSRLLAAVPPAPSEQRNGGDRSIASARATDPGSLVRAVRGDLDWITMKCLEKDRDRRYETAVALAMDVQRYLRDEPVLAGPPSTVYRVRKFVRRHRVGVVASSALGLTLVLGVVVSSIGWRQAMASARLAHREAAKAGAISSFLQRTLAAADPLDEFLFPLAPGHDLEPLKPIARDRKVSDVLDLAARNLDNGQFADEPTIEAAMRFNLGRVYATLDQSPKAERQLRRALKLQESYLGLEHRETLETLVELVRAAKPGADDYQALLARAREAVPRVLGARDRTTLMLMCWDAQLAADAFRDDLAIDRLRAVLAIQEQALKEGDPQILKSMYLLSRYLGDMEQRQESIAVARRALELASRVHTPDHLTTHMSQLQLLRASWGVSTEEDLAKAQRCVEGGIRHLGEDRENTLDARDAVLDILIELHHFEEAEAAAVSLIADKVRLYGETSNGVMYTRSRLGEILWKTRRLEDAETHLKESLRIWEASAAVPTVPSGLREQLFEVYKHLGRLDKARDIARESLALAIAFPQEGRMGPVANGWRDDLIYALTELREFEEAQAVAQEQVAVLHRTRGDTHPGTLRALNGLAWCFFLAGRYADAEAPAQEAVKAYRQIERPEMRLDRINATDTLAVVLCALGRAVNAEPLFREIFDLFALGTPMSFFAGDAGLHALHYGECLMQLHRYTDARAWLQRALNEARSAPGAQAPSTVALARQRLEQLDIAERAGSTAVASPESADKTEDRP